MTSPAHATVQQSGPMQLLDWSTERAASDLVLHLVTAPHPFENAGWFQMSTRSHSRSFFDEDRPDRPACRTSFRRSSMGEQRESFLIWRTSLSVRAMRSHFSPAATVLPTPNFPCSRVALRLNPAVKHHLPHQIVMLEEVRRRAHEFDVVHFHIDLLHFPLVRNFAGRTVTTLHGRLDLPDLRPFYQAFRETAGIDLKQSAPADAAGQLGGYRLRCQ
ncbi:hypothetical protein Rleg9DRAFT_0571 [Rhizobium leguminosarum bv. trifolii WSM597]|uniref:Uncharacterized protein n=1 Tax=Rhizobium leguminosarum bv. trifolii WSM597 TaxID=754764 RepID=J0GWD7_RHILT|nr:hypothetical protein Rleg9DRAFT_0571 [Rhizobium leguminosarum bv. trifolii WSM597]